MLQKTLGGDSPDRATERRARADPARIIEVGRAMAMDEDELSQAAFLLLTSVRKRRRRRHAVHGGNRRHGSADRVAG